MFKKLIAVLLTACGYSAATFAEEAPKGQLFDVVFVSFSDSKIQAIKVVRQLDWMGLKEAKDLVESPPKVVLEGVTKAEADAALTMFESVKCKAELRASAKTTRERFELVLKGYDAATKTQIVAKLQIANGWGLVETMERINALPMIVKKNMSKDEAARMKLSFTDIQADVEVKESGK